ALSPLVRTLPGRRSRCPAVEGGPVTAIAITSLLVLLYTYAEYTALIVLWAKFAPLPVRGRDDYEPTVIVCLAVHDGAAYIAAKIRSLQNLDYPEEKLELLIFSDGSTDGTERMVRE